MIGHSLGGSISLELQKNYDHITSSRTYVAPALDLTGQDYGNIGRYRNWFDPKSILVRPASRNFKWNPFDTSSLTHEYGNIAKNFTSEEVKPVATENSDNSISLIG